jgi:hypothetical protein
MADTRQRDRRAYFAARYAAQRERIRAQQADYYAGRYSAVRRARRAATPRRSLRSWYDFLLLMSTDRPLIEVLNG